MIRVRFAINPSLLTTTTEVGIIKNNHNFHKLAAYNSAIDVDTYSTPLRISRLNDKDRLEIKASNMHE